jgi:tyrosine-protein phosphatase non-receptor type 13
MKLRNSFVSIKSIADEMNIPLVQENFGPSNVNLKIDKPTKTTGLRVRNLKKSMLNDNRLLKLRDRFIKRSKSNVADFKRTFEENCNENNLNKENERPIFPSMIDLSVKSPTLMRNKVKMGTRVFSASYLNKSFDSLNDNQSELSRVDSWGALCIKTPEATSINVFNEQDEDEEMKQHQPSKVEDEPELSKDRDDEAYVIRELKKISCL